MPQDNDAIFRQEVRLGKVVEELCRGTVLFRMSAVEVRRVYENQIERIVWMGKLGEIPSVFVGYADLSGQPYVLDVLPE